MSHLEFINTINANVGSYVMGYEEPQSQFVSKDPEEYQFSVSHPDFALDFNASIMVINELSSQGFLFRLNQIRKNFWEASFRKDDMTFLETSDIPSLAISIAALRAVGVTIDPDSREVKVADS